MGANCISTFSDGKITVSYFLEEESGRVGWNVLPQGLSGAGSAVEPLVQVKMAGDDYPFGFSQGRTMRNSQTANGLRLKEQYEEKGRDGARTIVTVLADAHGCTYRHRAAFCSPGVLEVGTELENTSGAPQKIELLSSFTLGNLSPFLTEEEQTEKLILHRIRSTWSAEGRLISEPLYELQLEPSWSRFSANSMRFGQVGSMPVRGFFPFVAAEDKKNCVTWAVTLCVAASWELEVYRRDEALCLSGGLADREFGHWMKTIQPGKRFETPRAYVTAVRGNVDEAAQRITGHMQSRIPKIESEKQLPVIFNEFCTTWGNPTEELTKKTVDLLAGKGIRYFVIDAGWYSEKGGDWQTDIGGWEAAVSRFPSGIRKTTQYIRSKGMIPGIWFEFEVTGTGSRLFEKTQWQLKRDGVPITSGIRRFWDFRNEEVRDYLRKKVIGFLKENDFGYLKVDYNETIGIGCKHEDSLGEGLRLQVEAVLSFFDEIRSALPSLVIEVCSSGGHRLTPPFLERASMASFSDAHECIEIPVIAANMHRMIPPAQSQIWAVFKKGQPEEKFYYQITSAMLGRLCISGEVIKLDERQWQIIDEGIAFIARLRKLIENGTTAYCGPQRKSYRHPRGWQAVVRTGEGNEALVLIHSFENAPETIRVSLPQDGRWRIADAYHRPGICAEMEDNALTAKHIRDFDGAAFLIERE